MNCRTRIALCCAAIFAAVSFSTTTHGQTTSFTKTQVADRIRKVEDGVDQFRKYLENRGEDAKSRADSARAAERRRAASVQIQGTHKLRETKPSKQKTISKTQWTIWIAPRTVFGESSIQRRIIWRQRCKWSRSWTARAASIR